MVNGLETIKNDTIVLKNYILDLLKQIIFSNADGSNYKTNEIMEILQLSKNEQVFEQVSGPISNFKSLMMLLTGSVFALAVIILFLILLFTLRERIHEFGILLSLGISRGKIISQILLELFTIASGSYLIALFFGEFVANQFYSGLISSDDIPAQVKSLFESSLPQLTLMEGAKTLVIVIVIIVLAVLFSTAVILMKKPKKILSQMN